MPTKHILMMMSLDSGATVPSFREKRFLMSWLPQAERFGIANATHHMKRMNPLAVGDAAYSS
jgi:hypothetical protein